MPHNGQYTRVLPLYERVERPNPVASRFVDQPTSQARPYAVALPSILDERRSDKQLSEGSSTDSRDGALLPLVKNVLDSTQFALHSFDRNLTATGCLSLSLRVRPSERNTR